jgi:ABC-2 type transport system ATP-binding protein
MDASDSHGVRPDRKIDAGQVRHQARRHVGDKKLPVAVRVQNVSHVFHARRRPFTPRRTAVHALSSISLSVEHGQILAITGANGAGKTTLLDILATLLVPTHGDVCICGCDVRREPLAVRRRIAYCPAGAGSFWPRLTGAENLEFFAAMSGLGDAGRTHGLIAAAEAVGLTREVMAREVRTYSDGQAQRLNLARAFARGADVWLIDEPTRSLDPAGQTAMWTLIRERARASGATVIAATHDLAGVAHVADAMASLS